MNEAGRRNNNERWWGGPKLPPGNVKYHRGRWRNVELWQYITAFCLFMLVETSVFCQKLFCKMPVYRFLWCLPVCLYRIWCNTNIPQQSWWIRNVTAITNSAFTSRYLTNCSTTELCQFKLNSLWYVRRSNSTSTAFRWMPWYQGTYQNIWFHSERCLLVIRIMYVAS